MVVDHPRVFHSAFNLLSSPPEAYVIVWALALGDAVLPVLPSETALITAGLLSVVGDLSLGWVILAGAVGAYCGDTISYCLGRFVGQPFQRRFLKGERSRKALDWAKGQLDERGGLVLVVARYVPGGRTAATFSCGITHYPYAKFAGFDAVAAISWAVYASALGYFGGRFFRDHAWAALLIAFAIAGLLTLAVEGVRRLKNR
jgi:membrane protein DedA with SNARE-associated domain